MRVKDVECVLEAKKIIDGVKKKYNSLYKKYSRMKGNVLDGGYYQEMNAKNMLPEDYAEFIQLQEDVKWLDQNIGTGIADKYLVFIDLGEDNQND